MEELENFRSELVREAKQSAVLSKKLGQWAMFIAFLVAIIIGISICCPKGMAINVAWALLAVAVLSISAFFIFPIGSPSDAMIQKEIYRLISYKLEWNPIVIGCAEKEIEKQQRRLDEANKEQRLLAMLKEAEAESSE